MKGQARPGGPSAAVTAVDSQPLLIGGQPQSASTFDPATTAGEVALRELRRLLAAWSVHEPGARLGHDAEALHQLRVTARRIDATLGLFRHQLSTAFADARKTAKAVLRTLGAARDLDVQLAQLDRYCAGRSDEERAAAEPLRSRLEAERARARARMVRALDSEPTRRWLERLTLASMQPPAAGAYADPAILVMPERVRRRYRKLRKSVRRLDRKSAMEDYHFVRRRAKRLRYAIESGAMMFSKPAEDVLKALRRLQDKLGEHQDAYVARNRLALLAADADGALPPSTLFLMGQLAEHYTSTTADARKTLNRSWRKVRGKRWRTLRARLAALAESARAAQELTPAAAAGADDRPSAANGITQLPEPETHAIKH